MGPLKSQKSNLNNCSFSLLLGKINPGFRWGSGEQDLADPAFSGFLAPWWICGPNAGGDLGETGSDRPWPSLFFFLADLGEDLGGEAKNRIWQILDFF